MLILLDTFEDLLRVLIIVCSIATIVVFARMLRYRLEFPFQARYSLPIVVLAVHYIIYYILEIYGIHYFPAVRAGLMPWSLVLRFHGALTILTVALVSLMRPAPNKK